MIGMRSFDNSSVTRQIRAFCANTPQRPVNYGKIGNEGNTNAMYRSMRFDLINMEMAPRTRPFLAYSTLSSTAIMRPAAAPSHFSGIFERLVMCLCVPGWRMS